MSVACLVSKSLAGALRVLGDGGWAWSEDGGIRRVAVDFLRIEYLLGVRPLELYMSVGLLRREIIADRNFPVKAAALANVTACTARDVHAQPDAVLVIVDEKFPHSLHESAGCALVPQHLPAAAVVVCFPRADRQLQRLGVHVALHEKLAAIGIRRDNRDQAAVVEPGREVAAFLDLFDGFAGLKSDRRDRHWQSSVHLLRAGRIPIVAAGSNIVMIAFFDRPNRDTMTIQLHDTLRGKKVLFEPQKAGEVTMYLCGPTVYNYAHIGNARPAVVFDLLARVLRRRYKLTFARNITDVDDKINAASVETGRPIDEITAKYIKAYNEDMAALGVQPPDVEPRATQHVDVMIAMIESLVEKGFAYVADGHVLFDVASFEHYGELSKRDLREMIAGSRVEVAPYKKAAHDFVLWKPSTPELPGWDSPWGRGRPGWHIECSAMAEKHLGETIDIHAGGQDLIFPHHENERAQSRCAHDGAPFARYWLHNGFLSVDETKMSKSLGNVLLVHDLIDSVPGEVIRLALLSAHYRQPLDWSAETIQSARRMLDRLYGAVRGISVSDEARANVDVPETLLEALEDDLNTPRALAEFFALARSLNKANDNKETELLAAQMYACGELMGLLCSDPEQWFAGHAEGDLPVAEIEALIEKRNAAKAERDFEQADAIRDQLQAAGVSIQDGRDGTTWRRSG